MAVNPEPAIAEVTTPGPTSVSGDLTSDQVWSPQGSPYVLTGQVRVMDGVSVTLLPGTVVKFVDASSEIVVFGQVLSLGTPQAHVTFTSVRDDSVGGDTNGDGNTSSAGRGDWYAVTVRSSTSAPGAPRLLSVFDYTDMRYGGYGTGSSCAYAELTVASAGARAVVSNSSFTESAQAGLRTPMDLSTTGYLGVFSSSFSSSMCGIQTSGAAEIVGNSFADSFDKYAVWALAPKKVRFWFNTVDDTFVAAGTPTPTRAQMDVRYNRLSGGIGVVGTSAQQLADYAGNWWGDDLNTRTVPVCLSQAAAEAYQPPLTYVAGYPACGLAEVHPTGYRYGALPALSAEPQSVPASLLAASAARFGPVNTYTGALRYEARDFTVADAGETVAITRTYASDRPGGGELGAGWATSYTESLATSGATTTMSFADGSSVPFTTDPAAGYAPAPGVGAAFSTGAGGTGITLPDQTGYHFDTAGELTSIQLGDSGHVLDVHRTGGLLAQIVGVSGRTVSYARTGGLLRSISDSSGRSVAFSYDASDRLTGANGVDGYDETYGYDAAGRLDAVTSASGRPTLRVGYGAGGKVAWVEQAGSGRTDFAYDPATATTTATRADGTQVVQSYDATGRLVTEGVAGRASRHVVYDGDGRVVVEVQGVPATAMSGYSASAWGTFYDGHSDPVVQVDPVGATTVTTFNAQHRPVDTTNPDGAVTHRVYDASGRLESLTDPGGGVWAVTHDAHGQVTRVTDPLNRHRDWAYDPVTADLRTLSDETGAVSTYTTDSAGRTTEVTDALGHGRQLAWTAWDAQARLELPRGGAREVQFNHDRQPTSFTDLLGHPTTYEYDTVGRTSAVVDPAGGRTELTYDDLGRATDVSDAAGRTQSRAYSPEGWVVQTVDAAGNDTDIAYDPAGRPVRITDALGQVTQLVYDRAGHKVRVQTPDGATQSISYNPNGLPATYTVPISGSTPATGTWTYTYTPTGDQAGVTDPAGKTSSTTYDAAGRPATTTDAAGAQTTYAYDDSTRTLTVTDALGVVAIYGYDAVGQLSTQTDALGAATHYTYDSDGNLTSRVEPTGATTTYSRDLAGQILTQTDPLGAQTHAAYDTLGRLTTTTYPDTSTQQYAYDPVGNLLARTDRTGAQWQYTYDNTNRALTATGPLGQVTSTTYDVLGRPTQVTDPTGAYTHSGYDPVGRVAVLSDATDASWVTTYDTAGNPVTSTDPAGVTTTRTFDALSRTTSVKVATLASVQLTYDPVGRVTTRKQSTRTQTWAYDTRGRTTSATDPLGNTTTYAYDGADQLTSTTTPQGRTTTWGYDAAGRLTTATDPADAAAHYGYDAAGQLTAVTLPRGGVYELAYDSVGNLVAQTDPLDRATDFGYDAEGRLTSTTYPSGRVITNEYDDAGRLTTATAGSHTRTYTYDDAGRLTTATTGALTDTLAYDNRGLLTTSTDQAGTTTYTYDAARRLSARALPTGTPTTFTYTTAGLLATIRGTTNLNYGYDTYGQLTSATPVSPTAGGTDYWTYDASGRLTKITSPGYESSATYTADGQSATLTQNYTGSSNSAAGKNTYTLGYDTAGRLQSAALTRNNTPVSTTTYGWDDDGNRTSLATTGAPTLTSTYDLADQLLATSAGTTYTYDADGRQTTSAGPGTASTTATYDAFGDLITGSVGTSTATYTRDALGRPTTRTQGTTTTTLGYDATTGAPTTYQSGTQPAVALLRDTTGTLYAEAPTGSAAQRASLTLHGDVGQLRNQTTGTTSYTAVYDPYGQPTTTGTPTAPLGYQTMPTDPLTGTVDMGYRTYDPTTGRFTSADNLIGDLATPITLNRYTYANANPINYFDPDGHFAIAKTWTTLTTAITTAVNAAAGTIKATYNDVKTAVSPALETIRHGAEQVGVATRAGASNVRAAATAVANDPQAFVEAHEAEIGGIVAGVVAGAGCEAAAIAFTGGTATQACIVVGFTAAGAVSQALACPPEKSIASCAAIGAATGFLGGTIFAFTVGVGTAALGTGTFATIATGAAAGATSNAVANASTQALLTGQIDHHQVANAALIGGALGGTFAGFTAIRTPTRWTEPVTAARATAETPTPRTLSALTESARPPTANLSPRVAANTRGAASGTGRVFVGTSRGAVYDIPEGWAVRAANNNKGIVYQRAGAEGNADMVRIMEPTPKHPDGYVRVYNSVGQPVDVFGRPGPPGDTHIPGSYSGPWPGWPQ